MLTFVDIGATFAHAYAAVCCLLAILLSSLIKKPASAPEATASATATAVSGVQAVLAFSIGGHLWAASGRGGGTCQ